MRVVLRRAAAAYGIADDLLPAFDHCCHSGVQYGRLAVPCWGANTTRTEFAALTGVEQAALGFDRFNPYHAFARNPLPSLAWCLRRAGYRTLCLHPFDRRFFGRNRVMANLGFDAFLGEEVFTGATRSGLYVADAEVARIGAELLREEGPSVFVFAITMQNHGPWPGGGKRNGSRAPASVSEAEGLRAYLRGLKGADTMLRTLSNFLATEFGDGLLAFWGDHLLSFPASFAEFGFADPRTDYLIWRPRCSPAACRDLRAHELPKTLWDHVCRSDGVREGTRG